MVVVLAAGESGLVAGGSVACVEALDQAQAREQLERPVDGGDPDRAARAAQLVGDLAGAEHALLAADQLEHRRAGRARPVPGGAQLALGVLRPGVGTGPGHGEQPASPPDMPVAIVSALERIAST